MEPLQRRCSAQAGTITKIFNKMQKARADGEDTLDLPQLERHLVSLRAHHSDFLQFHEELSNLHAEELNPNEEDETLALHNQAYEEAESLAVLLQSLASIYNAAFSIKDKLTSIERMIGESPDKSFAPSLSGVQENLSKVEEKLITSSIPRRREVGTLVSELSSALAHLMASEN